MRRSVAAARSTGLRHLHFRDRGNCRGLQPLKVFLEALATTPLTVVVLLEREVEAAAEHSKIIFRSVDHAEAQVVSQTDVPRDSEFETGSELAERFGFAPEMIRLGMDNERVRRPLRVKDIPFAAAENRTDTGPGVGRKTCARNWITQCKCS